MVTLAGWSRVKEIVVWGQKVKSISLGSLEVLIRCREEEPAGSTNRTAITTRLRHNLNASLQELQKRLVIPDVDHLILPLTTHRHRHNIQPAGYYLSLAISTIPTNSLFA